MGDGPGITGGESFLKNLFDPLWRLLSNQGDGPSCRWRREGALYVSPRSLLGAWGLEGKDYFESEEHVALAVLREVRGLADGGCDDATRDDGGMLGREMAKRGSAFRVVLPALDKVVRRQLEGDGNGDEVDGNEDECHVCEEGGGETSKGRGAAEVAEAEVSATRAEASRLVEAVEVSTTDSTRVSTAASAQLSTAASSRTGVDNTRSSITSDAKPPPSVFHRSPPRTPRPRNRRIVIRRPYPLGRLGES